MGNRSTAKHGKPLRPRGNPVFTKPAMTVEDLAVQLENRGLDVPDHERGVRYLKHLRYFRLSPYTILSSATGSIISFGRTPRSMSC